MRVPTPAVAMLDLAADLETAATLDAQGDMELERAQSILELKKRLSADEAALSSSLRLRIPRRDAGGREQLVPGDRYYFSCLLRVADVNARSRVSIDLVTATGESVAILSVQRATEEVALHQASFTREAVETVALRVHEQNGSVRLGLGF